MFPILWHNEERIRNAMEKEGRCMKFLLPEPADLAKRAKAAVPRACAAAFLSALIVGLVTHLYLFTNKLPNHDDILGLFTANDMLMSGRWFLAVPSAVSSKISVPWVNGLLSLVLLAATAALTVRILSIKRPFLAALCGALLVTFPVVGHTLIYMFTADAYCFALLCAVLGLALARRYRYGFLAGGVLLGLSLACYQVYIFFAVALIAADLLTSLSAGTDDARTLVFRILRYVGALALGAIVYVVGLRILLSVRHMALTDYMGISSMGSSLLGSPAALLSGVQKAYETYFDVFRGRAYILNTTTQRTVFLLMNLLSIGMPLYALVRRREKRALYWVLTALLLLAFPLAVNAVYVINSEIVHSLMLYAYVVPMLLPLALYDAISPVCPDGVPVRRRQRSLMFLYLLCAVTVFSAVNYASRTNQTYLVLQLKFDNMLSLANRIVDRVEQMPEYTPDTPVWFQGTVQEGNYAPEKDGAFVRASDTPATAFESEYGFFMNNLYFSNFTKHYVGVTFVEPERAKVEAILKTDAFLSMPYYPYAGSVKYIDGIIFVRIGPGGTVL